VISGGIDLTNMKGVRSMAAKKKATTKKKPAAGKPTKTTKKPKPEQSGAKKPAAKSAAPPGRFVIMLQWLLDQFSTRWPVTARATTLAAIREVTQYDPARYELIAKDPAHQPSRLEAKSLRNSLTGQQDQGWIYELDA
jgi:hypothetical protein